MSSTAGFSTYHDFPVTPFSSDWAEHREAYRTGFIPPGICEHCGFRIDNHRHAPDCEVHWHITVSKGDCVLDGWYPLLPGACPRTMMNTVALDSVPVWTLLDWEGK